MWNRDRERPRPSALGPQPLSNAGRARRSRRGTILAMLLAMAGLGACRQDMHDQPRYEPLEASEFFADRRAARPLVEGTIPRGALEEDEVLVTGKRNGTPVARLPLPITAALVARGRERYDIFCAPCHDRLGTGEGMVVRRGFRRAQSFHLDRLRHAPDGHFFDVMTNGFGAMPDYRAQLSPRDRWAIVAYIRALQLSQHATLADVPPDARDALQERR